jgi:hypothetical protein
MAIVWLVVSAWLDVVAAGGAVRAFLGVRDGGHAHIRGLGTPRPLFVARPLSIVERGRPGGGGDWGLASRVGRRARGRPLSARAARLASAGGRADGRYPPGLLV